MNSPLKIGIVQASPVFNDLEASLKKAQKHIAEAAAKNADIVAFGECWLAGYPAWIDHCPDVSKWDNDSIKGVWATMFNNSLELGSDKFRALQKTIKDAGIMVVIGVNEVIKKGPGNGTIFNAILSFNRQGELINHHRKLMPTFNEKLIYGLGDGYGLNSLDYNNEWRIGSLICWEHWMPLTRQAMHDEGEDIHFALWPSVKESHLIASKQYAFEGRCIVVAIGQSLHSNDIPKSLHLPAKIADQKYLLNGGSCVIGPNGEYLLEPQYNQESIIYVDLPTKETLLKERMNLATSGHYQRPDIFKLVVNKDRQF